MTKFRTLGGLAHMEIKGCMPEFFLNECLKNNIEIVSAKKKDLFSLELLLPSSAIERTEILAAGKGYTAVTLQQGRAWRAFLKCRIFPALLGICIVLLLFWSKFYVWEIEISGNETVSDGEILSALSESGVTSGAFWPGFSADNIRSEVLALIPELSWITVNMHGSLAEVIAVERQKKPEMVFEGECASIKAGKEGFIRQVNTLVGQSSVKPGQIVQKGDVLISGVLESSFSPARFVKAQGRVFAETNTEYIAVSPQKLGLRSYSGNEKNRFALKIGNNRINFYSDSSISHSFCDKITSVWDLEIPGLFILPVSIVHYSFLSYESESVQREEFSTGESLKECLRDTLCYRLGSGEVLGEKLTLISTSEDLFAASLRVRCLEEIGVLSTITEAEKAFYIQKYTEKADDQ